MSPGIIRSGGMWEYPSDLQKAYLEPDLISLIQHIEDDLVRSGDLQVRAPLQVITRHSPDHTYEHCVAHGQWRRFDANELRWFGGVID